MLQLKSSHAATKDHAYCNEDARRKISRTSTKTRHSHISQQKGVEHLNRVGGSLQGLKECSSPSYPTPDYLLPSSGS